MPRPLNRLEWILWPWINRHPEGYIPVDGGKMMLRYPVRADMERWVSLRAESEHFLRPWEPQWPEDDLSPSGYLRRLRSYRKQVRERTGFTYFLVDASNNNLLGGLSLTRLSPREQKSAMLGYWMGKPHAGRGIMRCAVTALLDHAFDTFALEQVNAACLPRNARSIALLRKVGFQPVGIKPGFLEINGVMEDHLLFSLSRVQGEKFSVQKSGSSGKTSAYVV